MTLPSLSGATIAFDLDGTLVDTAPDLIGALNLVLAEHGLPPVPVSAARALVGKGARFLIEHGFEKAGAPLAPDEVGAMVDHFIVVYRGRIAAESMLFPGIEAALDRLKATGAKLVVCTNKRTELSLALLDALGMTAKFEAVVGADRAPAAKPDPRHFLAAVAAVGGDPTRAILVGDSLNDVASARGAGAPSIVVSFGYTETPAAELGGDLVIDDFSELDAACERLLAALPGAPASAIASRS